MIEWLKLTPKRRVEIITQVNTRTGINVKAIEKDWWVTLVLHALFSTKHAEHLVFKGGTSLSKAWGLIERFSEDIDLSINRSILGFGKITSNSQVKKLRKASAEFITNELTPELQSTLVDMGVSTTAFNLFIRPTSQSDIDPQVLELHYKPDFGKGGYITDRVLIEIGARSLREPCSSRPVSSLISQTFPHSTFAAPPFTVMTVDPSRTILEKIFLLHEMFQQPEDKWKHERLSRHLYDIHMIKDTPYGTAALTDPTLYKAIVEHRSIVTAIRGVDYNNHIPEKISFIPPLKAQSLWAQDYSEMKQTMIYGTAPEFPQLIERLVEFEDIIRSLNKNGNYNIAGFSIN